MPEATAESPGGRPSPLGLKPSLPLLSGWFRCGMCQPPTHTIGACH